MKRAALVTAIVAAGAAAVAAAGSCSSSSTSSDNPSSEGGGNAEGSTLPARDGGGPIGPEGGSDASYVNEDGWQGLSGFDPACGIYVAPSPSAKNFPPPIAWEACDPRVQPADGSALDCRQVVGKTGFVNGAFVNRTTQSVLLTLLQSKGAGSLYMLAEADGPVHQAIVTQPPQCGLDTFPSVSSSTVMYEAVQLSASLDVIAVAAVGGPIDGTLSVLRRYGVVQPTPTYFAGTNEFVEYGGAGFNSGAWTDGHKLDDITTKASGQLNGAQFQDDNFLFSVGDLNYGRIELFKPGTGTVDFVSLGDDGNHYATNFGTDGTDMVWTEATGHPGGNTNPWTTIDVVTAPYTTNAASITKRRLMSEARLSGTDRFVVGCGYAAHDFSETTGTGVRIVRLSDGRSWTLLDTASPKVVWNTAVAITCSEVFVNVSIAATDTNLARIRLDSLGPGIAAN